MLVNHDLSHRRRLAGVPLYFDQPCSSIEEQASAARPDFNTLDTKKKGPLTSDDVKSNKWLRTNFARCDSDHDGTVSREEYIACK